MTKYRAVVYKDDNFVKQVDFDHDDSTPGTTSLVPFGEDLDYNMIKFYPLDDEVMARSITFKKNGFMVKG